MKYVIEKSKKLKLMWKKKRERKKTQKEGKSHINKRKCFKKNDNNNE